ncbi:riboflavin synthase [Aquibacillus albus]|uniref:Riboflavin synthase n=1 Tax=Aquibacillus albus TaxID=1168171 RepID=A0ABS2MZ66_9BACI|nr:riboflavin synthase [Aquibacillus albus]MBM7571139.1 riboflavin synthase [Aquibacillus albus]
MFTGIVEEKGKVISIARNKSSLSLTIEAAKVTSGVAVGDSISVNGVCLTVTSYDKDRFLVDVIPETFRGSSLAKVTVGSEVNLERAMSASGRFGGHFVSGHVDAVGTIDRTWTEDNAQYIFIAIPTEGLPFVALKGSICVDGTSLTVFGVEEDGFVISLIPETRRATVIGNKKLGDVVNVEYDMLAKYMDRLLTAKADSQETKEGLTEEKLKQFGF